MWNTSGWTDSYADIINDFIKKDVKSTENMFSYNCKCSFDIVTKPKVKRAIFNPPATIILWTDGTKSVVKCQNGEPFDAEKGFALAYLKKLLGNKNEFNKEIHKWVTDDATD